eukprot:CAMPEP_0116143674 /NCGR_PEP_ID=MMETSP0329-20121206/15578_1 /TAXON_ID=697910 /ORGANISM="Pseudo-nitzschia arenysensis, Strain B593" /LENGTH=246 /DNA_ID=CAMNT_0003639013 /DNA_START=53 /DNA_END=793 /DNA_ORIENTATION=+
MATASMTMASQSMDHPSVAASSIDQHVESREESIEKLKVALVRYGRANDRRMILRTLKNVSFLSYIPMEAPIMRSDVSLAELEKEVFLEQLILNNTLLSPPSETRTIKNAGTNSGCLVILKGLTKVLCANSSLKAKILYDRVVQRLVQSSAAAEVYVQLNSILGSTEVIIKILPNPDEPSSLNLYNTGGQIHMTLETKLKFGLFRRSEASSSRAWIVMDCKVHERANLSTNESFRSLNVKTPDLYC